MAAINTLVEARKYMARRLFKDQHQDLTRAGGLLAYWIDIDDCCLGDKAVAKEQWKPLINEIKPNILVNGDWRF